MNKTIEQLVLNANTLRFNYPELRLGQALMIVLGDMDLELYRKITVSEDDCFYNDDKQLNFIKRVKKEWE